MLGVVLNSHITHPAVNQGAKVETPAQLKNQGRGADFRIQDVWIASLAVQNSFPILTRNTKDFADIPGVELLSLP